jgi:DNA (cytosine-5)-methyltransferase 1
VGLQELALFAGAGGGLLGGVLLGWDTVCAVEWDQYACDVLRARQRDGVFHDFPIWSDVKTFNGRPWRGRVDVITAGFPCQPLSVAGRRQASADLRDGWPHTARILGEVRPRWALLENVPGILTAEGGRYFGRLLGDVAALGYDARWCVLGAADVGAPHQRDRWWCLLTDAHGDALHEEQIENVERRLQEIIGQLGEIATRRDANKAVQNHAGEIQEAARRALAELRGEDWRNG